MPSGIYPGNKGRTAWNKGVRGAYRASEETKAKLREKRKGKKPGLGRKQSEEERQKRREIMLALGIKPPNCTGLKHSEDARKNMSAGQRSNGYMQHARGSSAPNWRGGIAPKNRKIRDSTPRRGWVRSVLSRDGDRCRNCGATDVPLHVHHIKEFSKYPDLRFEVDNGLTLCKPCHYAVHGKKYHGVRVEVNGILTAQTPAT